MCLTGIIDPNRTLDVDATALNRRMVLNNQVLFGTVNAGRRHWQQAVESLAAADLDWLNQLITRRVPLTSWSDALERQPDDIKVVVDLTA
jgi:glucose 1-dehydrogenase